MRAVSATWAANQAETLACPSRLDAWVDTYTEGNIVTQLTGERSLAHVGGTTTFGQPIVVSTQFVLEQMVFKTGLSGWSTGATLGLELWTYDPTSHLLIASVATATAPVTGDYSATETVYTFATPPTLAVGNYIALLLAPTSGTLSCYYGTVSSEFENMTSSTTHAASSEMTPAVGEALYHRVVGHNVDDTRDRHWVLSNESGTDNVIDASVTSTFDVTRNSFPVETAVLTVQNGTGDYDFTTDANKAALKNPGQIGLGLGYRYSTSGHEVSQVTGQRLDTTEFSDDRMSVSFKGTSFALKLDNETFHDGRYRPEGISAYALFQELLDGVFTTPKPGWAYRVGAATCKVNNDVGLWKREGAGWSYRLGQPECVVSNSLSLFEREASPYYTISPALKSVIVNLPIPPMTYREALVLLAAYSGAWILHRSDGTIDITTSLGSRLDYHFDTDRVYDVPKRTTGQNIGVVRGAMHTYEVGADTDTTLTTFAVDNFDPQEFRVEHDAYDSAVLTLDEGATLVTVRYNTYSTVFTATPLKPSFVATVTGYPVTIGAKTVTRDYGQSNGDAVDMDNVLASDLAMTLAMFDHYRNYASADKYTFTMRDDPSVEVGDRTYLDTLTVPTGESVIVTDIKRSFNGGVEGEYTLIIDPNPLDYDPFWVFFDPAIFDSTIFDVR